MINQKSVDKLKVLIIAAPLVARSGVYNSARETVRAANDVGLPWSLLLGVSQRAGLSSSPLEEYVTEISVEPAGLRGVFELSRLIEAHAQKVRPDIIISMIPQSDMALARLNIPWVAYLRGMPWPVGGEASGLKSTVWELLERQALKKAAEIWVTTTKLQEEISRIDARIVPAGIEQNGTQSSSPRGCKIVWAARFDKDKDPSLFLETMSRLPKLEGRMYGIGPCEGEMRNIAPPNVDILGWVDKTDLWNDAGVYVGTSTREAFGRSAVEAALRGIPCVLSEAFGVAPSLYTDDDLMNKFVLTSRDPTVWAEAIQLLSTDTELQAKVAEHVRENAQQLTIQHSVNMMLGAVGDLMPDYH